MGPFRERRRWRSAKPKIERDRTHGSPAAFAILRALIILMFGALTLQLINLQVLRGPEFKERAEINALREVPLPAARGLISDRNGQPLVENSARFSAAILPGDLPERGEASVYRLLSGVSGVSVEEIDKRVREGVAARGEFTPVVIKQDIDHDTALVLQELAPHAPGLQVITEPSRRYLSGSLLSHVLGYVGPISPEEYSELKDNDYLLRDFIGKSGIESTYESALRGKPGKKLIEVDSTGRELKVISERRPIDGSNLQLSIDTDLQRKTAEVLNEYAAGSDNAAAAVMDVKTGELLATVSWPGFDSNVFSGPLSDQDLAALVDSPGKPLVNHLIADRYPPGSTFKTIVGAGALQEGIAAPWTTITSRGYITVENEFDPNVVRPMGNKTDPLAGFASFFDNREYYETQYKVITSERVLSAVVRDLGLQSDAEFMGHKVTAPVPLDDTTALLRGRVRVEPIKGSRLVWIKVEDTNPKMARRLTDAVEGFLAGHRVLICDRDGKWTEGFRDIVGRLGGSRRPNAHPGAECQRLRGTVRALDSRGVSRPHDSLRGTAPDPCPQRVRGPLPWRAESSGARERLDRARTSPRRWHARSLPRAVGRALAVLPPRGLSMG